MKVYVKASKTIKIGPGKFEGTDAKLLSEAEYESQKKNLDYQFRRDGYKFYSKPGKQYSWTWYAVPANEKTRGDNI